jgi:zinc protease
MHRYRLPLALMVVGGLVLCGTRPLAAQSSDGFFPYEIHKRTLENGLDVIVIPMLEFENVLSYNTLILAGARNETEPGKSGLAHLFEHIQFRHMWQDKPQGYEEAMSRMGAFNNAWTWFDVTFYHLVTFASNLNQLASLEADRFTSLKFTEEVFVTEAGTVLGEYRNSAADPGMRMDEVQLAEMYGSHGYGHTTMGYLEDVEDLPNEFEAAIGFYNTYYRPNNVVMVIAGDVEPAGVFELVESLYGSWEPGLISEQPDPEAVGGPKQAHVDWEVPVPPRITVSYKMPAHRTGTAETAVGQLLPELLVSETAPLYKKLRYEEQLVQGMGMGKAVYESFDDGHLDIGCVLFQDRFASEGEAYFERIVEEVQKAADDLTAFSSRPDAGTLLRDLKSKYRYDTLAGLNSPAATAQTFVLYYRFERDPAVMDKLVASVEALEPGDIDLFASTYLVPANRVVVTMNGPAGGQR